MKLYKPCSCLNVLNSIHVSVCVCEQMTHRLMSMSGPRCVTITSSPLISGGSGQAIHHGCQRRRRDWLGMFVAETCVLVFVCVVSLEFCSCKYLEAITSFGVSSPAELQCRQAGADWGAAMWSLKTQQIKRNPSSYTGTYFWKNLNPFFSFFFPQLEIRWAIFHHRLE